MAESDEDGSFLSRWSRRKRAIAEEDAVSGIASTDESPDDPQALARAEAEALRQAEELADMERNRLEAEAIDIETLKKGDDFSAFFKKGVPHLLKRQAMRKLWTTNPVFANLDGLNDYDEDFRNPAHNVYKSLWQAGRGFLSEAEQNAQRLTGRLRIEDDAPKIAAEAEAPENVAEDEAGEPIGETLASEDTSASQPPDPTVSEPVAAAAASEPAEAVGDQSAALETTQEAQPTEDEAPVRRRVSLRRRLEG